MVRLFHLAVHYKKTNGQVVCLKDASDLSSFGFFQRNRYESPLWSLSLMVNFHLPLRLTFEMLV